MKHVVIDPITRIEGHLRTEVTVDDGGKVTDAISSGTAWRGLELVMNDRDPRDAWAYIQRICGVCTSAHALASLRSVEDALGIRIPKNANYIRNIMAASLTVQDHLVHFYHLTHSTGSARSRRLPQTRQQHQTSPLPFSARTRCRF